MYDAEVESPRILAPGPFAGRLQGRVAALSASPSHNFAKAAREKLTLLEGLGVEGDAHCGALDQHLFLGKPNPPPNLRQLHLFPGELMDVMAARGFQLTPGAIGENLVSRGVDLLSLPLGAELHFSRGAAVRLTGRRTPCRLVDRLGKGLMKALGGDGAWGERPIAGVMAVIVAGGEVRLGDAFCVRLPEGPHQPLPGL